VAHSVVNNETEAPAFLHEYFGQAPDKYQLSRFFVIRQLAHMFYGMGYMLFGSSEGPEDAPNFRDIHDRVWTGAERLADSPMKFLYGRAHWQQYLRSIRGTRFSDALRIVSNGPVQSG